MVFVKNVPREKKSPEKWYPEKEPRMPVSLNLVYVGSWGER